MRPLTWALKEVDSVGLHRQSGIHGIAPKQNAFKFKIAPHKQKSIVNFYFVFGRKMGLPGQRGPVLKHT
jgi:hypothetical protein